MRKTNCLSLILAFFLSVAAFAQPVVNLSKLSAASIPYSLRQNAIAVYRLDEGNVEVISPSRYIFKVHQVATVLNNKGDDLFDVVLMFDKLQKVDKVEINVFDSTGNKIASYTSKDFSTKNYDDRMSVFTDDKLLYLEIAPPAYPCTIEKLYTVSTTGYLSLPRWTVATPKIPVELSHFTVSVPAAIDIRHKEYGFKLQPVVTRAGDKIVYQWTAENIMPPTEAEDEGYDQVNNLQVIAVSPNQFVYDGFAGQMKTWKDLGNWNFALYNDEKGFLPQQVTEFKSMVASGKTDREKIALLYKHLKKSMRYVSVQLGIGGFKPFAIQYVHEKQYGDCKALTNYMRYMLRAVDIKAYPALVSAGSSKAPFDTSFPASYFNHVILCVPLAQDTIWLECTSNNNQPGELGSFTENRNALLLTENGGLLVRTPNSNPASNIFSTHTVITINEDGGGKVQSNIACTGDFSSFMSEIEQENSDDKKRIFSSYLKYKSPDTFLLTNKEDQDDKKSFGLQLSYDQLFAFKAGSKMFFDQRINKIVTTDLKPGERKQPYLFRFPYEKTDTTIYILPASMKVESLPAKKEISTPYLAYSSECFQNEVENKLVVITRVTVKQKVVAASAYAGVADSFSQLNKNEGQKIVLRNE